jgi:hypothetical protein
VPSEKSSLQLFVKILTFSEVCSTLFETALSQSLEVDQFIVEPAVSDINNKNSVVSKKDFLQDIYYLIKVFY